MTDGPKEAAVDSRKGAAAGAAFDAARRTEVATLVVDARDPVGRAGGVLADMLEAVLAEHERVRLAIPGGSALAAVPIARERLGEAWKRVQLTWVDERCVPLADLESNRGAALRIGAWTDDPICDPTHDPAGDEDAAGEPALPLYLDDESPSQALRRVAARLARDFDDGLDVVLIGMGEDGHIASLFPSNPTPNDGLVAHVPDSPKPPAERITLTRRLLATAQHTILVATGEAKHAALNRLWKGDPTLPAHGLPGLIIVSDTAPAPSQS